MKNYEEMAESVLQRSREITLQRKQRKKKLFKTTFCLSGVCLIILFGTGIVQSGLLTTSIPGSWSIKGGMSSDSYENSVSDLYILDSGLMVYVNDTLYIHSTFQPYYDEWKEEFVYLGEIKEDITKTGAGDGGIPNVNFQANHPIVGNKVYQYNEEIVILINNEYWIYEKCED